MMLVPTTLREVAVLSKYHIAREEGVDMSPYNEFRLRRLIGSLHAAEFGVECWEKAKYTPRKSRNLAHAKAVAQYWEYKLNSFLKHHGVEL